MYRVGSGVVGRIAAADALLVCGACGGDSGTGPGGGGDGLGGNYELVGINNTSVPAVAQMENCSPSRFLSGTLSLTNGRWQIEVQIEDEAGQNSLADQGEFRRNGSELEFQSATYGDQFWGELEDDLVVLYYDFCTNEEHDIDFVFE